MSDRMRKLLDRWRRVECYMSPNEVEDLIKLLQTENQRLREEVESLRAVSTGNSTTIYMGRRDGAAIKDQGGE